MDTLSETHETIWTIGHSTRPIADFIELLSANDIETVADVRRFPSSRSHPQYNQTALEAALAGAAIDYIWLPSLGGRRRPVVDSPNSVWRNDAFRGYADHIATEEFANGLFDLLAVADGTRTAIMCSEAVWWRCHRSIIADVLCSIGFRVLHIMEVGKTSAHPYTAPARIVNGRLTYSVEDAEL
ncbi:MAG TPA: DUF488 domain-containing protein [Gemmatimonadaceae bacterium]